MNKEYLLKVLLVNCERQSILVNKVLNAKLQTINIGITILELGDGGLKGLRGGLPIFPSILLLYASIIYRKRQ